MKLACFTLLVLNSGIRRFSQGNTLQKHLPGIFIDRRIAFDSHVSKLCWKAGSKKFLLSLVWLDKGTRRGIFEGGAF